MLNRPRKMGRFQLLPMELPSAANLNSNGNVKTRIPFVKRLIFIFIILVILGLLYVPAYHSAQSPILNIGETPSTRPTGGTSSIASVAQLSGWAHNTSRDLYTYIHPENNTSIINPLGICSPAPYLLIIICSAVTNQKSRMAIRNTWASRSNLESLYNVTVKTTFLLGQSDNGTINEEIAEENLHYNDIIQEKFHDTYNNLTLKSVMMLKWVTSNCNQTKYLMKTDDDMFVNIPNLLKSLYARPQSTGILLGSLICNARPISDPKNKWYTPKYMYSGKTYPNYLSGTGYVMSIDVVGKLYQAALSTPLLHLEDVYITGLCAKRTKIRPTNHPGFSYVPRRLDPCIIRGVITAHKVNASSMQTIWGKLQDTNLLCSNQSHIDRKSITLSQKGRNAGYYLFKRKNNINRCL